MTRHRKQPRPCRTRHVTAGKRRGRSVSGGAGEPDVDVSDPEWTESIGVSQEPERCRNAIIFIVSDGVGSSTHLSCWKIGQDMNQTTSEKHKGSTVPSGQVDPAAA